MNTLRSILAVTVVGGTMFAVACGRSPEEPSPGVSNVASPLMPLDASCDSRAAVLLSKQREFLDLDVELRKKYPVTMDGDLAYSKARRELKEKMLGDM